MGQESMESAEKKVLKGCGRAIDGAERENTLPDSDRRCASSIMRRTRIVAVEAAHCTKL